MTDSFGYQSKTEISDEELLQGVVGIRAILDTLRAIDPAAGEGPDAYLATYDDAQNGYNAVITEARRRGLQLPTWVGDTWFYSDLDGWSVVDDL